MQEDLRKMGILRGPSQSDPAVTPRTTDAPPPSANHSPPKKDPISDRAQESVIDRPPAPPTVMPPAPPSSEEVGSALRHAAAKHKPTSSGGGSGGGGGAEIVLPSQPPVIGAAKEVFPTLGLSGKKEATLKATMGGEGDSTGLGEDDFFDFAAPKISDAGGQQEGEGAGGPVVGGLKSLFSPSFRSAAAAREASHATGLGKQVRGRLFSFSWL